VWSKSPLYFFFLGETLHILITTQRRRKRSGCSDFGRCTF